MAKRCILILGGARSGKSRYAQELAEQSGDGVMFVATAEPLDDEMKSRIENHKRVRPATWQTLEAPENVGVRLNESLSNQGTVIIDCITLLASNILGRCKNSIDAENAVVQEVNALIDSMKKSNATFIIVSNEIGLGIVPENDLARQYRDVLGRVNQILAKFATDVYFMIAGIPVQIKCTATL
ncbi:MAG TPA: bifunctional adenosylcobinamide kinase/adenosylcobinamide-phosphate guanylyltransferase [Dehalococcoidia bacterium]|nr:bifunctional adenosylcobinamide kinase/adenosylcobinamide-phosphate guanylyltransferase [Dehalococcoidia bacterium]